jgi:hypothetical protein
MVVDHELRILYTNSLLISNFLSSFVMVDGPIEFGVMGIALIMCHDVLQIGIYGDHFEGDGKARRW